MDIQIAAWLAAVLAAFCKFGEAQIEPVKGQI
jgi:hypothetical protein